MTEHVLRFPAAAGPVSLDQLNDADREMLSSLARDALNVVDVGTFLGASAEVMLDAMPGSLVTLDIFTGVEGSPTGGVPPAVAKRYACERLSRFGDRVTILESRSLDVAKYTEPGTLDLVFIDAAHDYGSVRSDILAWMPALKEDGIMAGHDFDRRAAFPITYEQIVARSHLDWDWESGVHCGVVRAVSEIFSSITMSPDKTSSVWCARKHDFQGLGDVRIS